MKKIDRVQLQQQMEDDPDLRVVEVLPTEEYEKFHIPGAINVPLDEDFDATIQRRIPDKSTHVAVYCANTHCPASEKAAEKLDQLGYQTVYDYEAGKEDWKEAGLSGLSGKIR